MEPNTTRPIPLTHEQRQELIHRPFFITYMGSSYPWGGVAVADNFFGTGEWAERPLPTTAETGTVHNGGMTNKFGLSPFSVQRSGMSIIDPFATAMARAQETT